MVVHYIVPISSDRVEQLMTLWSQLVGLGIFVEGRDKFVIVELDSKPYNLGVARNLGAKYSGARPDDVLCFHDVAIVPLTRNTYPVPHRSGVVTRVYCTGHPNTLGAVTSMTKRDFDKVGGWVSKFGWGEEDVAMFIQCKRNGLTIDTTRTAQRFGDGFSETSLDGTIQERTAGKRLWLRNLLRNKVPNLRPTIDFRHLKQGDAAKKINGSGVIVSREKDFVWIKASLKAP